MGLLIKLGNGNFIPEGQAGEKHQALPAGLWEFIEPDPMIGTPPTFRPLNLPFVPEKIYGNPTEYAERYLQTFTERVNYNTGILLAGEKGSGKSMLMNKVALEAINQGFPVIQVNYAMSQEAVLMMLRLVGGRCVITIDEYEKKYGERFGNEHALLGVLDGLDVRGNMFILSVNESRLSPYMINRPNRIHYTKVYEALPLPVMREYLGDHLVNKDHLSKFEMLYDYCKMNFDIMQNLTAELNRYPQLVFTEAVKDMGLQISSAGISKLYQAVSVKVNGKEVIGKAGFISLSPSSLKSGKLEFTVNLNKSFIHTLKKHELLKEDKEDTLQDLFPYLWMDEDSFDEFSYYSPFKSADFLSEKDNEHIFALVRQDRFDITVTKDGVVIATNKDKTHLDVTVVSEPTFREETVDTLFA